MGKSKPWPKALKAMTGSEKMSVEPLKNYFRPLDLWLRKKRCELKYRIGWKGSPVPRYDPCVVPTTAPLTTSSAPASTARCSDSTYVILTFISFVGITFSKLAYV